MDKKEFALKQHEDWHGKIEVVSRAKVTNREELSVAYTPGVAEPCLEISKDVDLSYKYTRRSNLVAVITDGTAVLGLGDIGPEAGMPVMEKKPPLRRDFQSPPKSANTFSSCVSPLYSGQFICSCGIPFFRHASHTACFCARFPISYCKISSVKTITFLFSRFISANQPFKRLFCTCDGKSQRCETKVIAVQ